MSKPLLYYCGSRVDEPVFRQIEQRLKTMTRSQKLEMAHAALSLNVPHTLAPLTKDELEKLQLINYLSPQGQLELVQALVTSAREP